MGRLSRRRQLGRDRGPGKPSDSREHLAIVSAADREEREHPGKAIGRRRSCGRSSECVRMSHIQQAMKRDTLHGVRPLFRNQSQRVCGFRTLHPGGTAQRSLARSRAVAGFASLAAIREAVKPPSQLAQRFAQVSYEFHGLGALLGMRTVSAPVRDFPAFGATELARILRARLASSVRANASRKKRDAASVSRSCSSRSTSARSC